MLSEIFNIGTKEHYSAPQMNTHKIDKLYKLDYQNIKDKVNGTFLIRYNMSLYLVIVYLIDMIDRPSSESFLL